MLLYSGRLAKEAYLERTPGMAVLDVPQRLSLQQRKGRMPNLGLGDSALLNIVIPVVIQEPFQRGAVGSHAALGNEFENFDRAATGHAYARAVRQAERDAPFSPLPVKRCASD